MLNLFVGVFSLSAVFASLGALTVMFGRRYDADTADNVFGTVNAVAKVAAVSVLAVAVCLAIDGIQKAAGWLLFFGGGGLLGAVLFGVFACRLYHWYLQKEQRCGLTACGIVSINHAGSYGKRHHLERYSVTLNGWTCGVNLMLFSIPHLVRKNKSLLHEGQTVSVRYNEEGEVVLNAEHAERLAVIGMVAAVVAGIWCFAILGGSLMI